MASIQERLNTAGETTYVVRWREDGKQRSRVCANKAAARKTKALVEANDGLPDLRGGDLGEAPTFAEWAPHYLAHLTAVSPRTRDDYSRQIERHMGALAELPLPAITRDVTRRWVLDTAQNVSGKTLKNLHGLLHGILAEAVEAGHLDTNPLRRVRLPRTDDHQRVEMTFLTAAEFWLIAEQMDEHWRRIFVLLVTTGMRLGELMALTVGDVDLAARQPIVRITKSLRYVRGKGYEVGSTKTTRSRRTIAIPPSVVDDLRPLVARPKKATLVVQPNGKPMYPTNLYARVWRPAVLRAQQCAEHRDPKGEPCGCEGTLTKNPRIHDLRHSHVAWLIAENVPLMLIQSRLGHEQQSTTSDRYGHLVPDLHIEAAAATQRALER